MVSKASELLPEPDTPLTTVSLPCGISQEIFFRLCVRAPRMMMASFDEFKGRAPGRNRPLLPCRFSEAQDATRHSHYTGGPSARSLPVVGQFRADQSWKALASSWRVRDSAPEGTVPLLLFRAGATSVSFEEFENYAATASIHGHCATEFAVAACSRFSTLARPSTTADAQAGQCIAEFPTELQSWQR